jgi:hypothetical protein
MVIRTYKTGLPKCYYENLVKCVNNQFSYLHYDEEMCIELLERLQKYVDKKLETRDFQKKITKTRHG